MDEQCTVLAKKRLPEGAAGMAQLHELIGRYLGEDAGDAEVAIGIETDRGRGWRRWSPRGMSFTR
jgi:hypothetical protein